MSGSEGSGWLLVPMEVSALVVGKDADDEGKKLHWSDLAPDYTKIWKDYALFGPDLVALFPEPGDKSLAPPDAGIHLHWLLPEAFGHGIDDGQGGVDYPDVPNRWLVRRVCYAPGTCDVRDLAGWIVESYFLHQTDSKRGTAGAVSMPVLARQMLFDSVGRVTALGEWSESSPAYRFRLTALGSGSPDFASFYPACKSILGFHDPDPAGGARFLLTVIEGAMMLAAVGHADTAYQGLLAGGLLAT